MTLTYLRRMRERYSERSAENQQAHLANKSNKKDASLSEISE